MCFVLIIMYINFREKIILYVFCYFIYNKYFLYVDIVLCIKRDDIIYI